MRERELTIKGQEILTSDKVAVRVSILTQFRVVDPVAAVERGRQLRGPALQRRAAGRAAVAGVDDARGDPHQPQPAQRGHPARRARRSAAGYGVEILRADVKDIVFPGNLQEIMNRVLAAERLSEAQLVEARTKAETSETIERPDARPRPTGSRPTPRAEARAAGGRGRGRGAADPRPTAEVDGAAAAQPRRADAYAQHPALLRLQELETLADAGRNAQARIYIGFDKHALGDHRGRGGPPVSPTPVGRLTGVGERASFVLASASPARLRTLRAAGIDPRSWSAASTSPWWRLTSAAALCATLARLKAEAVGDRLRHHAPSSRPTLVLGCDSVLAFDGEILGKPADAADAVRRWRAMRGRSGVLHTGHCLIDLDPGRPAPRRSPARPCTSPTSTDDEIAAYVAHRRAAARGRRVHHRRARRLVRRAHRGRSGHGHRAVAAAAASAAGRAGRCGVTDLLAGAPCRLTSSAVSFKIDRPQRRTARVCRRARLPARRARRATWSRRPARRCPTRRPCRSRRSRRRS